MIAVIGDIHGCYYTLRNLVQKINSDYPDIPIFSVGDLVDRGNFSFEVIDFMISKKINFTVGNHDLMFYNFIKHPSSTLGTAWLYNGYEKTVLSYDNHFEKLSQHLELIHNSPFYFNFEDCFISHAGISKNYDKYIYDDIDSSINKLEEVFKDGIDDSDGILWTRNELLNIGKLQVVGHTRMNNITYKKQNNAVYIDTSAYTGNMLSSVIIENGKILRMITEQTDKRDFE